MYVYISIYKHIHIYMSYDAVTNTNNVNCHIQQQKGSHLTMWGVLVSHSKCPLRLGFTLH